ncbi:MAG TPA: endonuclease/exonuclease/phosphatase family protein [Vicinamibacterales bacterium]|nr:endonuclease/exonuclease/phosphatase family protein [Vicinamibacterales bacterium]
MARERPQLGRRTLVGLALAVALIGAGCATPGGIVAELPAVAGCRTTVAPDGAASTQQIRWIRPDSPDERAALDDWCRGVGPGVVVRNPRSTQPETESSELEPFSRSSGEQPVGIRPNVSRSSSVLHHVDVRTALVVISWNVNVGGGDVVGLVESLRSGALTGQPVSRFVLLLQEAFRDGPEVPRGVLPGVRSAGAIRPRVINRERIDIVSIAETLGLALAYVPSMRNGDPGDTDEDRGNAILSTEPLSDVRALELPFERQRRVAIEASVRASGPDGIPFTLRVTNVHLDNRAPAKRLWLFSSATRLRQVRGLLLALAPNVPTVVGGDFNTWYGFDDPVFNELATTFGSEIPDDRRPTFAGLLRLDHLFFRLPDEWQATTSRIDRFGSDHHPLMARIGM